MVLQEIKENTLSSVAIDKVDIDAIVTLWLTFLDNSGR